MGLIVRRVGVPLEGLPSASAALTIAHLSDFHLSPFVAERHVRRAVEATNAESPDLIALTGDYVTQGGHFINRLGNALAGLHARLGVYAVLGNHDHLVGGARVAEALATAGIRVLNNENHLLCWVEGQGWQSDAASDDPAAGPAPPEAPSCALAIVGVDDPYRGKPDLVKAMRGVEEAVPTVVLSHNPDVLYPLQGRRSTLILSGHTHGGQVFRLGRHLLRATTFGKKQPYGLHRLGKAQIYITSGIGTTFLPIRLFCPAEVALLRVGGHQPERKHGNGG